jgi:hypothetical protein
MTGSTTTGSLTQPFLRAGRESTSYQTPVKVSGRRVDELHTDITPHLANAARSNTKSARSHDTDAKSFDRTKRVVIVVIVVIVLEFIPERVIFLSSLPR